MGLFDRALQRKVLDAVGQYFTSVELERARVRGDSLILFDARFTLQDGELRVASVPADAWLRDRVRRSRPTKRPGR